jgi:hypothetical protein
LRAPGWPSAIINAAAAYPTSQGTYVVLRWSGVGCPGGAGDLVALKIDAAAPPQISVAWCARQNGSGSPNIRRLSTPLAAKGRIFVASDTAVYAFTTQ